MYIILYNVHCGIHLCNLSIHVHVLYFLVEADSVMLHTLMNSHVYSVITNGSSVCLSMCGLVVRLRRSHCRGRGSIPCMRVFFFDCAYYESRL